MKVTDLSPREQEVYALAIEGLTNSQLASQLHISEATVKTHMSRIMKKMAVRSRVELAARARPMSAAAAVRMPSGPAPSWRPPRWWWGMLAGVAAVSLIVGVMSVVTRAGDEFPELARPATAEDRPGVSPPSVAGSSIRFVASLAGTDVYLARSSSGSGVCVVTIVAGSIAPVSVGCAALPASGAAFGVADGLTIVVGDAAGLALVGRPVALSESVVAYVDG